jgi:hypothetical protein
MDRRSVPRLEGSRKLVPVIPHEQGIHLLAVCLEIGNKNRTVNDRICDGLRDFGLPPPDAVQGLWQKVASARMPTNRQRPPLPFWQSWMR